MDLKNQINYLSNHYAVTQEELMASLVDYDGLNLTQEEYLSFHAIMKHITRESKNITNSFLNHVIKSIEFKTGFTNAMIKIHNKFKSFNDDDKGKLEFIQDIFGKRYLSRSVAFIYSFDSYWSAFTEISLYDE